MQKPVTTKQKTVTITSTTETTILDAVAGAYVDLASIVIANSSATGVTLSVRDATGGSVMKTWYVPPTDTRGMVFSIPFEQKTLNKNWTIQSSVAVTSLFVTTQGFVRS